MARGRCIIGFVAAMLLAAVSETAIASLHPITAAVRTPGVTTRPVDHLISKVRGEMVHDAVWTPEGKTFVAEVEQRERYVEVWMALTSRWPEAFSVLLAIVVLAALRRGWRWREPVVAGTPHCAKCGYCLTGTSAARCPECGAAITECERTIGGGRPPWRRAAILAALAVLLPIGIWQLETRDLPRVGTVSRWFRWRSTGLAAWNANHPWRWLWSSTYDEDHLCIVEIDPSTGAEIRTIATVGEDLFTKLTYMTGPLRMWRFAPSEDPERVALCSGSEVVVINLRSRTIERRVACRDWRVDPRYPCFLCGDMLYAGDSALDLRTGMKSQSHLSEVKRPALAKPVLLEFEYGIRRFDASYTAAVCDRGEVLLHSSYPQAEPLYVRPDLARHRVLVTSFDAVLVLDADTGVVLARLELPGQQSFVYTTTAPSGQNQTMWYYSTEPRISPDGRRVLTLDDNGRVIIHDDIGVP